MIDKLYEASTGVKIQLEVKLFALDTIKGMSENIESNKYC
jgi:polyphosphate kinase